MRGPLLGFKGGGFDGQGGKNVDLLLIDGLQPGNRLAVVEGDAVALDAARLGQITISDHLDCTYPNVQMYWPGAACHGHAAPWSCRVPECT